MSIKGVDDLEEIVKICGLKEYGQYSEDLQIQHDPS